MRLLRIAIVGFGKIAADQHVPSIRSNSRFELAASSSRSGEGVGRTFTDWREMIASTDLDAVAITTPPRPRYEIARACLEAGLHVLLEKPPTATLSEIAELACIAESKQRTLFATWHARHNAAVGAAAEALAGKRIEAMEISWLEDAEKWHPGQQWVWQAGGFGVFDPGINAFSIATAIFPGSLSVESAALVVPDGAETPIEARITFASEVAEGPLTCTLDWRRRDSEEWLIRIRTSDRRIVELSDGGARLAIDGRVVNTPGEGEYSSIYSRFLDLIDERRSDVDVRPLRLVADCLLVGSRTSAEPR